ncbi:MAG TPA: ATP-dependent DNA helicase [Solirubrobacteraceae bacterium]|nr:ATP-dependent DNA helicase [Solirubrobacteraceae bacterium]
MSEDRASRVAAENLDLFNDGTGSDDLTPAQRTAAVHECPRMLLLGVAGAGKTRTLQARFQWLLHGGVAPERIAVLAPTANRARALEAVLETYPAAGFEQLQVLTPASLGSLLLSRAPGAPAWPIEPLSAGDRLAMLAERAQTPSGHGDGELSLRHHDFGGRPTLLLGSFVRRIDRLKAELIDAERYLAWATERERDGHPDAALELEFAQVYVAHERMLMQAGARDDGGLVIDALALARARGGAGGLGGFTHLLIDDAQELDLAAATLALELGVPSVTIAGDPDAALRRYRGAGAERLERFRDPDTPVVMLERSMRCAETVWRAARAAGPGRAGDDEGVDGGREGSVEVWRCANERSQAQSVAIDVERLVSRERIAAGDVAVLVSDINHEGQAVAAALQERAIPYRLVGEAAFFQRAEVRDLLAWLRLAVDPTDAAAVVRALARPPVELRSVDIARCTQIARRRKLDMVSAMAAATESPQVPPEARDRLHLFLKLYRASVSALDSSRPDLYVHRLIERLGLRRQQLFAAHPDVVARLRALARFGELAGSYVTRLPQATAREFAVSIAAAADYGLREHEEPELATAGAVQVLARASAGGLEAEHVYVIGLHAGIAAATPEPIPEALVTEPLPGDDGGLRERMLGQELYVACSRARRRLVLAYPRADDRGVELAPAPALEDARRAVHAAWTDKQEELFGPAEGLASTYRLLRDELMSGTARAGGRLAELRFDTDLDVTHAVVRYLELLKLAALMARPDGQSVAESLHDINARILQACNADQREIFETSSLDEYLLDSERDARARAAAVAARDEPTLEPFLPLRGDGVMLSASDIDTYRTCPLKYKFARVFRIPQEPTINQRFGILVHQVLERYHAASQPSSGSPGGLPELLGLLDAGWRRGGFGDSEQERQLRVKATTALTRYHERFATERATPVWFERQFQFKLGRHMLRGRVDRVDRLPGGEYELIDYKTGRPKDATQLADDVQLSLYAVGAREAWRLDASRQAYYYLLDDEKVAVPDDAERDEWVREVATEVAEGIRSQGFEPTPSYGACSICDYRLVCPAAER